jgi:ATP synthase protein I
VKKETAQLLKQLGTLSTLGIAFAVAIAIGTGIGYLLDRWLDTLPRLTILFFFLGVAAGYLNIFRAIKRLKAD